MEVDVLLHFDVISSRSGSSSSSNICSRVVVVVTIVAIAFILSINPRFECPHITVYIKIHLWHTTDYQRLAAVLSNTWYDAE